MRLIYLDAGLASQVGHHANLCRHITGEVERRGGEVVTYASTHLEDGLRQELKANPFFRWHTYLMGAPSDPVAGWLTMYEAAWWTTLEDLRTLPSCNADDHVFVASVMPAQLLATIRWFQSLPLEMRPRVTVELGTEPGVYRRLDGSMAIPDPRSEPRPILYRHAAAQLQSEDLERFRIVTFDSGSSDAYTELMKVSVGTLPLPHSSITTRRSRKGRDLVTVAFLGHQRTDKGYHLVPDIVAALKDRNDVRFLIHNGAPTEMKAAQAAVRDLAATQVNVKLDERGADRTLWKALLDEADLIVCPYDPARFAWSYSAVAAEALAEGIPLVVPDGGSLSRLMDQFGQPGTSFSEWTAEGVTAALQAALDDYEAIAARAAEAARAWEASQGAKHLVDMVVQQDVAPVAEIEA